MKKQPLSYVFFFILLIALAIFVYRSHSFSSSKVTTTLINAPYATISVEVADTETLREHGLSDRVSLGMFQGMLFVYPDARPVSFWMKDMHFSLDMVWIDEHKTVIGVTENVSPDTYPNVFVSPGPIKYVLEINAGSAKKMGLEKGKTVNISVDK